MAKFRAPLPSTADLGFIRASIKSVNEIRTLRKISDRHVLELREQITKRVVNALWNRYKRYHKGDDDAPSFLNWLLERGTLDNTYLMHSIHTRLRWVYRVITTVKTDELALVSDTVADLRAWYFESIEQLINDRQPDATFRVVLNEEFVDISSVSEPVPTIRFNSEPLHE